jgi:CheY-like chemotaxis protein
MELRLFLFFRYQDKAMPTHNTVLVIEDNKLDRLTLEELLKLEGYDLLMATNGNEGLEKLKSHQVDLVLVDVVIPEINGFEVCQRIRNTP